MFFMIIFLVSDCNRDKQNKFIYIILYATCRSDTPTSHTISK